MRSGFFLVALACIATLAAESAAAQSLYTSPGRAEKWEVGFEPAYVDSQKLDFGGGSTASFDGSVGFALTGAYHYNENLEVRFGLGFQGPDYRATIVSADNPNDITGVRGTMYAWTPSIGVAWNLMKGPITPYVSGNVGWSFIDTNIPNGPGYVGCVWYPFYGYICSGYQPTKGVDGFTYSLGAGLRWDAGRSFSLRVGYERQWLDIDTQGGTPSFDVFRIGFGYRY